MENYLTQITNYLLTQSWQIAVLVTVIAVSSLALKSKSAHVRYLLWLIVLAKCLVPPLLTIPLAVLPEEKPAMVLETMDTSAGEPSALPSAKPAKEPVPTLTERPDSLTIRQCFGFGWFLCAAAFVLMASIKALRTNLWLLRERKPLPGELQTRIAASLANLEFTIVPKVWLVDGIGQPFVWGLLRGSIYLPGDFVKADSDENRIDVLCHELSHVQRFDAAVNILQVIGQAIFWFHPFVWWANKKIRAEREKCCDEMAIARLGAKAKDYSTAIVSTLITEYESTRPVPSLAVAGPVKNIEERIKTIMKPGKKFYKRPSLIAAIAVFLLALLIVPTALVLTARTETKAATERKDTPTKSLHEAAADGNIEQVNSLISQGADINTNDKKGRTPLHFAAKHGHKGVAELLIAKGADVNVEDKLGHTALHLAARFGHAKVAKILVDHSADVNAKNMRKVTALHYATKYEFWEIVKLLVAAGADVDVKDETGTTPMYEAMTSAEPGGKEVVEILLAAGARLPIIHIAAYRGDVEKVRSCLEEGTGVNAKDEHGGTPLHAAANSGRKDVIKLLISEGADLQAKDAFGDTPLHFAAMHGYEDVAKLLLARGVNVNTKDQYGYTPLHWAATRGHKKLSELLIAKGADVKAKSNNFEVPLHCAAWMNQKEVAKLLISRRANVNVKDKYGWTPLHWAAKEGYMAIAEMLIAKGADLNPKKYDGGTPLHSAASEGRKNTVELLIAKGANVNARDKEGRTPLWRAKDRGHKEIADLLRKQGAKDDSSAREDDAKPAKSLHQAAADGDIEQVKSLISQGADINTNDKKGRTPLHFAAKHGHKGVAELLIAQGADVNVKAEDGWTPLQMAAITGLRDVIELLIVNGADVNATNKDGYPALHGAAVNGHKDVVELLIAKGADVNAKGRCGVRPEEQKHDGFTPLHFAAECGHNNVVEFLLAKGADVNAKDEYGRTPLFWACNKDTAKLLVGRGADINAKDNKGGTALTVAKEKEHKEIVRLLRMHEAKEDTIKIELRLLLGPSDIREVKEFLERENLEPSRIPGDPNSRWYLLNAGQVKQFWELARLNADYKVLMAPTLEVVDGKTAMIRSSQRFNYVSGYSEPNRPSEEPKPIQDSVETEDRLQVKPKLQPDSQDTMKVYFEFEISNLTGYEKYMYKGKYPYEIPIIEKIAVAAHYKVGSGETLLLCGWKMTDRVDRTEKKDLLVLITTQKVEPKNAQDDAEIVELPERKE